MEMEIVCGVESCDCVSREAVEKIINKYIDGSFEWGAMLVEIKKLPSIKIKSIECDTVSRDAVKNEIKCWIGSGEHRYAMAEKFLFDRINDLPGVPNCKKRKRGDRMTNKEAIEWFKNSAFYHKDHEPFNMAISALEKENIYDDKEHYVTISKALYDKLNVDACDDAISRERVHQMLDEYMAYRTNVDVKELHSRVEELPSVQPKPIECDAISREAALEKMADYVASGYADSAEDFEEYSKIICQLPSVQPSRNGHWVGIDEEPHEDYECDRCGKAIYAIEDLSEYKFCPNCGADMRGVE